MRKYSELCEWHILAADNSRSVYVIVHGTLLSIKISLKSSLTMNILSTHMTPCFNNIVIKRIKHIIKVKHTIKTL